MHKSVRINKMEKNAIILFLLQKHFQNYEHLLQLIFFCVCVFVLSYKEILLFTIQMYNLKTVISTNVFGKCHNEMYDTNERNE